MAPEDDTEGLPMLAYRMGKLEKEFEEFRNSNRSSLERFSERVDRSFASLRADIANLSFVSLTLYERDRATLDKELTSVRADAENARKVAWGAVVVFVTAVVAAVVAIAMKAAA